MSNDTQDLPAGLYSALPLTLWTEEIMKNITWLLPKKSIFGIKSSTEDSFLGCHLLVADLNGDFRKTYMTHCNKFLASIILLIPLGEYPE